MFNYISDAGHGWLEVSLKEYPTARNHATGYGYLSLDGSKIYLEEDSEMPAFLRSIGITEFDPARMKEVTHYGDSPIRNLPHNYAHVTKSYASGTR